MRGGRGQRYLRGRRRMGDTVYESPGQGSDTVERDDQLYVGSECGEPEADGDSTPISGTGNDLANSLTGECRRECARRGIGGGYDERRKQRNDIYLVDSAAGQGGQNPPVKERGRSELHGNLHPPGERRGLDPDGHRGGGRATGSSLANVLARDQRGQYAQWGHGSGHPCVRGAGNDTYIGRRTPPTPSPSWSAKGSTRYAARVLHALPLNVEDPHPYRDHGNQWHSETASTTRSPGNSGANTLSGGTAGRTFSPEGKGALHLPLRAG